MRGHVPAARIAAPRTLNGALEVICPILSSCKSLQPRKLRRSDRQRRKFGQSELKVWLRSIPCTGEARFSVRAVQKRGVWLLKVIHRRRMTCRAELANHGLTRHKKDLLVAESESYTCTERRFEVANCQLQLLTSSETLTTRYHPPSCRIALSLSTSRQCFEEATTSVCIHAQGLCSLRARTQKTQAERHTLPVTPAVHTVMTSLLQLPTARAS